MGNPAETYESYMVPIVFAPLASSVVSVAAPKQGERILDVGCGTGIVARCAAPLVEPNGEVAGVDPNPNMLLVAREAAERDEVSVNWHEGRAEDLPFPDGSFSAVLCQQVLQFCTNQHAALSEMNRVLVADGRATVAVWQGLDRHPFYRALNEAIDRHVEVEGDLPDNPFAFEEADELRRLLAGAGFDDVEIQDASITAHFPNPQGYVANMIEVATAAIPSMQHLDGAERQAVVGAINQDMQGPMKEFTQGDHVVTDFHAFVASARRAA